MCGIVGYFGKKSAQEFLLGGLNCLEYRGYDSAGMAIILEQVNGKKRKKIVITRAAGKVMNLERKRKAHLDGFVGIAHTRWATHGKPSEKNAHPHTDCTDTLAVVHNGIIENYHELKRALEKKGHRFRSETDTEVIAHLLEEELQQKEKSAHIFEEAFVRMLRRLRGAYGIVVLSQDFPEMMLAARLSSPLVLGIGSDEYFVASDVAALGEKVKRVVYLDDHEIAVIRNDGYTVKTLAQKEQKKEECLPEKNMTAVQRGGFAHFMLKEIFEQPKVITDVLRGRVSLKEFAVHLGGLQSVEKRLRSIRRIFIVACGTSYHSGIFGKYILEELVGIPTEVEVASEFRYREMTLDAKTAVLVLSQSGETADTLAAVRKAKEKGALTLGIVNVVGSSIAREADAGIYCHAGPEISVASTKAYTAQLIVLILFTLYLGEKNGLAVSVRKKIIKELLALPQKMESVLRQSKEIKKIAKKYAHSSQYVYLGRKYNFSNALEGALKIKEIAYVSAQGYPTGEMKHGPIALVDESVLTIMMIPKDSVYEKNVSGAEEILARGGNVWALVTEGDDIFAKKVKEKVFLPKTLEIFSPILSVIPLQLFAYYIAVERGYDVDRPRNLAKSVTVE
ncbi:MAG: glutamine--fructose-6-phosphate transaminase (isomerizing) [Candidatus Moranbacteria bacterium]|nr:glutamine--fructose-6-phosphate transaminase (isomerizing) [Candidatus Moranbacteria bacterium]